ncbi:MAG: DUF885 domain-containing protein [Edaphobacter sp.]
MKRLLSGLLGGLVACCTIGTSTRVEAQPPLVATTAPTNSATAPVAERSKALSKLFADIWEDRLKHSPEFASSLGDKRYDDQLTDYSAKAVNDALSRGRGYLEQLSAIDTTGLPDQERLSAELMLRSLVDDQEEAKFKEWEMPVSQFSGIQIDLPRLVNNLQFDSAKDYDNYISRLKKLPGAFSQIMTNMQLGVDEGRVPPQYLLEKALIQTQTLADQKPEASPFTAPLKRFPSTVSADEQKRISGELLSVVTTDVLPSYQRFAKFLKFAYIPNGRKDPGVWALPDGNAYYAFKIRQNTTLNKSAAEIHQLGIDEVKRDEAEMLTIAQKLGFSDLKSFNVALKANPKERPTSAEQMLDLCRGYIAQMQPKLPELFGRLPKAPVEVVAMPAYVEKNAAPAYYEHGTADGRRPGRVNINTYDFADRSLAPLESMSYHEGVPGHHLQISIAQELTGLPEFRKHLHYTAYSEGWGMYSERLGKDVGFFQDPYNDYGRLEGDIWRAIRLVVDTGVHSQHWTRQQMVDYFHEHSGIDEPDVQAEVDRYIASPGQALGYKVGQLEILALRDKAKMALGSKFDIKAFHDELLDSGPLPLDVLERRVDAWIAAQKK